MLASDGTTGNEKRAGCAGAGFGVKRSFALEVMGMVKTVLRGVAASLLLACALFIGARIGAAQGGTIAEKTKDSQKLAGYFNLYWDAKAGRLWLEIDKWDSEFLYRRA
jgi:hypothetical protein